MRRIPAVLLLLAAAGGAAAVVSRARRDRRDCISLHYADGSSLTLEEGAPSADRVLAVAREALAAAR